MIMTVSARNVGNGKMRYEIKDVKCSTSVVRCEVNAEGGYKIPLLGEDVVHGEDGFYVVVFDKKLKMVVDAVKISGGQIVREQG